jgi:hypothetical protein
MLHLIHLVIGQASQVDPALVEALTTALLKVVGAGGSGTLLALVVAYLGKRWLERPEDAAKLETRAEIKSQSESLAKVASSVEETSRIQERLLRELDEMRRESRDAHNDIKAELRRVGS